MASSDDVKMTQKKLKVRSNEDNSNSPKASFRIFKTEESTKVIKRTEEDERTSNGVKEERDDEVVDGDEATSGYYSKRQQHDETEGDEEETTINADNSNSSSSLGLKAKNYPCTQCDKVSAFSFFRFSIQVHINQH